MTEAEAVVAKEAKTCPICKKLFTVRKKTEKNRENTIYCSRICKRNKKKEAAV